MRILYLIRDFNFGGAENHVSELANSMRSLGNEVFILSRGGKQEDRLDKSVHYSVLKMNESLLPIRILQVCLFLRRNKIDIIHAHKRSGIFMGCIAGKLTGIPVVATIHGRPRHDLRSIFSRKFTDRFIFVSKRTMMANISNKCYSGKSVLIHNGITRFEKCGSRDPGQITYLSRIDKRHYQLLSILVKNVIPALADDFPGLTFHIVGEGPCSRQLSEEVNEVNKNAHRKLCVLHGYVPEVAEIVHRSGLLLGVGRCAMDGISCSTPVLPVNSKYLGNFVNVGNYISYEENNFVPVGQEAPDLLMLGSRLRDYLSNQEKFQKSADELSVKIKERLSMEIISARILKVYSDIIAGK